MTLWRGNDVRKFDADAILFREIQCMKTDIFMFKHQIKAQKFHTDIGLYQQC